MGGRQEGGPRDGESFQHFCQLEGVGKGIPYRGNSLSKDKEAGTALAFGEQWVV